MRATLRPEYALPVVCLAAAAVLAASEFIDTFQFVPPTGDPLDGQTGGDRHGYALLILALLACVSALAAVATGTVWYAITIAGAGAVALIVFLTLDLPDAGTVGNFDDGIVALANVEAEPRLGFWLALLGSLGLIVGGAWLALLTPDQRMAPARALETRRRRRAPVKREQKKREPRGSTRPRPTAPRAPASERDATDPGERKR